MAIIFDPEDRAFNSGTNQIKVPEWIGRDITSFGRNGYYPSRKDIDYNWNKGTGIITLLQEGDKFDGSSFHIEFSPDLTDTQESTTGMTNYEALIAAIGIPGYNDLAVIKAMIDGGIDGTAVYVATYSSVIDTAALKVLKGMLGLTSIQEGDYQVQYAIKDRIKEIEDVLGIGGAIISNASFFW